MNRGVAPIHEELLPPSAGPHALSRLPNTECAGSETAAFKRGVEAVPPELPALWTQQSLLGLLVPLSGLPFMGHQPITLQDADPPCQERPLSPLQLGILLPGIEDVKQGVSNSLDIEHRTRPQGHWQS